MMYVKRNVGLPWHVKYCPQKLDEMVGLRPKLLTQLKKFVRAKSERATDVIFYGKWGVGKTCAAHCIVNELYGEYADLCYIEINAAKLTKTEMRVRIEKFARRLPMAATTGVPFNICIIDECQKISERVETMLRTVMGSPNLRFILIANEDERGNLPSSLVGAISSRGAVLKFDPIPRNAIYSWIRRIAKKEGLSISDGRLMEIAKNAKGDIRAAINTLQVEVTEPKELPDVNEFINEIIKVESEKAEMQDLLEVFNA